MHDDVTESGEFTMPMWRLARGIVLRSTGVAFDQLVRLRCVDAVGIAWRLAALKAEQTRLAEEFSTALFPVARAESISGMGRSGFDFWNRLARKIQLRQPLDDTLIQAVAEHHRQPALADWLSAWRALDGRLAALHAEGTAVCEAELADRRQIMHTLINTPHVREAIWLSSPAVTEEALQWFNHQWEARRRPSRIKKYERTFYLYLQRFCAKNDTASFFGPLNYGQFDPALPAGMVWQRAAQPLQQRQAFFAYWAASALGEHIAATPEIQPYLTPRRNPLRHRSPPAAADAAVYGQIDQQTTVLEMAARLDTPIDDLLAQIQELARGGWLLLDLPIPPATLHPLAYLAAVLHRLPPLPVRDQWLATIEELRASCAAFAAADLAGRQALLRTVERRFTELTGLEPRRGHGQMFQDRTLIYEECQGDVAAWRLSQAHAERIHNALAPVAHLAAICGQRRRAALHEIGRQIFAKLSRDGAAVPLVQFLSAWWRVQPTPSTAGVDAVVRGLAELVALHQRGRVSYVSAEEALRLCGPLTEPVVLSPDVLLAAPDGAALAEGRYRIGVGEIHHGVQGAGWMTTFVVEPEAWERDLLLCLPQPDVIGRPANCLIQRTMKTTPPEFPGPSVQLSAVAGRPPAYTVGELLVEHGPTGLQLRAPDDPRPLWLYPLSFGFPPAQWVTYEPFLCFSYPFAETLPIVLGTRTPRIMIGEIIYQRERWDLPRAELPDLPPTATPFQQLSAWLAFQQRWELPDDVFVHAASEPKPIYINFHTIFALEVLSHLLRTTTQLSFVEMWPAPDQLWLADDTGRHCSELRLTMGVPSVSASTAAPAQQGRRQ